MCFSKIRIATQKKSSKRLSVFMSPTEVYEYSFDELVVLTLLSEIRNLIVIDQ